MVCVGWGGVRTLFRLQRTILALLFLSFICGMVLGISLVTNTDLGTGILSLLRSEAQGPPGHPSVRSVTTLAISQGRLAAHLKQKRKYASKNTLPNHNKAVLLNSPQNESHWNDLDSAGKHNKSSVLPLVGNVLLEATENGGNSGVLPSPNYNVHVFYYPWYGTPMHGGHWLHWNHDYLPHWDKKEAGHWRLGRHEPPHDIGSSFYPNLGPYSSRDPVIMENHMRQIRSAGIGVLAVSWYPKNMSDDQGQPSDDLLPELFDIASKYKLKICLHIEPYKNRTIENLHKQLKYIIERFGKHPALYRQKHNGRLLPIYYIYDSYLTTGPNWAKLLHHSGSMSVRNTNLDAVFIGLLVEAAHKADLVQSGFDGFYTYFASDGFTYGSTSHNWVGLSAFAASRDIIFIPSIGPGYVDVRIRPWNAPNSRDREQGGYYEQSFKAALIAKTTIISITSFNEWHEGTQIECAVPKKTGVYKYIDYSPHAPDYYLTLTRQWVHKFSQHQTD